MSMKTFMAILTGSADSAKHVPWDALSDEARNARVGEGMAAWQAWMGKHADQVADTGGPLGATLRVNEDGIAEATNSISGYVIVQAESREAAARMFIGHPHFSIFPGDGVDIMEIAPIPGA
ncbi:MAG: hypothetical protein CFE28_01235 [Alphaproteobacteria bacterium PA2]|nr:MAG: hypothetical protein CFE28_01235 [Alphaproteobacteria bacterium PA2]